MAENEKMILETISKAIEKMSDTEKAKFLAFVGGMACMDMNKKKILEKILETISKAIEKMSDTEKAKLLAFVEGMACMAMMDQ